MKQWVWVGILGLVIGLSLSEAISNDRVEAERNYICNQAVQMLKAVENDPQASFTDTKGLYALYVKSMPSCPVDRTKL
jgi:hypothetical protein